MNIVVFENEYENIRASFEAVNLIYFQKALQIVNYPTSQDCSDLMGIDKGGCIFVDIDLSTKSRMDGFEIITELLKIGFPSNRIAILTGHINIAEKTREKRLNHLLIVSKPIAFPKLREAIEVLSKIA